MAFAQSGAATSTFSNKASRFSNASRRPSSLRVHGRLFRSSPRPMYPGHGATRQPPRSLRMTGEVGALGFQGRQDNSACRSSPRPWLPRSAPALAIRALHPCQLAMIAGDGGMARQPGVPAESRRAQLADERLPHVRAPLEPGAYLHSVALSGPLRACPRFDRRPAETLHGPCRTRSELIPILLQLGHRPQLAKLIERARLASCYATGCDELMPRRDGSAWSSVRENRRPRGTSRLRRGSPRVDRPVGPAAAPAHAP